jgi:MFS family permease
MLHGRPEEAGKIVGDIERDVEAVSGPLPSPSYGNVVLHQRGAASLRDIWATMFGTHRDRAVLGLVLMSCQAFFYNAVFFTYALVLTRFYGISPQQVGWFMLPFALGNLAGPLLLGRFFDTIGRKPMITTTYGLAGVLMAGTGIAFAAGWLSAWEQTLAWTVIFFFASAAASAAYLTVGESFPLEMRAMAIALFYAIGTAVGGVIGPTLFGWLIESGQRNDIMWGYMAAAALMVVAALTEWRLGFAAERKPLEEVSAPLAVGQAAAEPRKAVKVESD